MPGSWRTRASAIAAAVAIGLGALLAGSALRPAPVAAAYCDDYPFLCLTYTAQPSGNGAGTVTTSDGFINCRWENGAKSGTCSKRYVKDQDGRVHVPLTVTADSGSYACYISYCELESVQVTPIISGDFTDHSAKLLLDACTPAVTTWCSRLTFALTGAASGSVETTDGHIACSRANGVTSGTCTHLYFVGPAGSLIQVSWAIEAPPGVRICENVEDCTSGSGTVTQNVGPYDDVDYDYSFEYYVYTVTVAAGGSGVGSITSTPSGINCGATCSDTYHYDDALRLTASPQAGSRFESWTGPCAGQDATCDLKVRDSATIVATFLPVGATAPPPATSKPGTATPPGSTAVPGTSALASAPAASSDAATLGPGDSGGASPNASGSSSGSAIPGGSEIPGGTAGPVPALGDATGGDLTLLAVAIVAGAIIVAIGLAIGLRGRGPRAEEPPAA